jgi:hypothetical protein
MGGLISRLRRVLVMDVDLSVVCVVFWSWTCSYREFASNFARALPRRIGRTKGGLNLKLYAVYDGIGHALFGHGIAARIL